MAQATKVTKDKTDKKDKKNKAPAFATRLKELRMEKNWSLREVEKRAGGNVSRQTVLRAEQGDAELSTIIKLLGLYGVRAENRTSLVQSFNEHQLHVAKQEN